MKVWSWRQAILKSDLPSTTKLVLLVLSSYMNDHGAGCYPSIDQIARDASLTDRAVTTHLGNAEASGFLVKKKRNLRGKEWASNEYYASTPSDDEPYSPLNDGVNDIHPTPQTGHLFGGRGESASPQKGHEGGTTFPQGVNDVPTNSPMNSPLKDISSPILKSGKRYPQEFELLWLLWPAIRRCEKPTAYAAWCEACKKITPEDLLAAFKRYLLTDEAKPDREGKIYVPYPAKWLKRERWLEFPEQAAAIAPQAMTVADIGEDTPQNRDFLQIMTRLRAAHGDAVFRSWFQQLRVEHKNCTVLSLTATNRFNSQYLKSHFEAEILRAVGSVWPEITQLQIAPRVLQ